MLIRRLFGSLSRSDRSRNHTELHAGRSSVPAVEDLAGSNKLVRGRHGIFLANENDIYIGRALIAYGEFCELEWNFLRDYCRPGAVVVEVGANIGGHTVNIAKAVGPSGRVLAIEPQPPVYHALCANLALNGLFNVDALNCGCADGSRVLNVPAIDYGKEGNFGGVALREAATGSSIPVRCEALDSIVADSTRVDLLKVDVEGMEHAVLSGARQLIERLRPVLYVENDRPEKSQALVGLVHALGYRAWWHMPALYNPNNYYGNAHNLYPQIASFNMLCLPANTDRDMSGLRPVVADEPHPLSA